MTFKDRLLNSMTFQAWKIKRLNSMTFQVFHDPYEPWGTRKGYLFGRKCYIKAKGLDLGAEPPPSVWGGGGSYDAIIWTEISSYNTASTMLSLFVGGLVGPAGELLENLIVNSATHLTSPYMVPPPTAVIQWNLDLTKSLGTDQIFSLNRGFVKSKTST